MPARVTVVLLNWKRPENLKRVVESLWQQEPRPQIFLWNNATKPPPVAADWIVDSSRNKLCWPRWFMASQASTEYICSLDDDLALTRPELLAQLAEYADRHARERICGPWGVRLLAGRSYLQSDHVDTTTGRDRAVDIVKGRLMFFRRELLSKVPLFVQKMPVPVREDDIVLSGLLSGGRTGFHRVPGLFSGALLELPEGECGMDKQAAHFENRDRVRALYFRSESRLRARQWVAAARYRSASAFRLAKRVLLRAE